MIATISSQISGVMNRQRPLVGVRRIRSTNPFWRCQILLAYILCYTGSLTKPVDAANIGKPSTVRPLHTRNDSHSLQTPMPRRVPFLPSRNPRRAAKEAYLLHLQNELESAQRQLYVSQDTCATLRKRWEDQRRETLALMVFHGRNADIGGKEQQKINDQETEIARLQEQLQMETEKHEEQLERINLMSSELKELQSWKEIEKQSYEGKLSEYEHQLQESNRKQSDYAEQVQLLALKLEAVEFVARQRQPGEEERGESKSHEQRVQVLRSELDSVRAKYLKMLINSVQDSAEEGDKVSKEQKMQVEKEMDSALQAAFESAFDTIDNEWSVRYEALENHLSNITEYAANLAKERDSALQEAEASLSAKDGQKSDSSGLSKSQKEQFRDELTAELTVSLTDELTEKLTKQLSITLVKNIETKYKKKLKRLRKDLKVQQAKTTELEGSQEDMTRQQIEVEIEKVKDQYKQEYESKLHQLQIENEAQVRIQKERMRKLVRALLEREAKQKGEKAEASNATAAEKIKSPSRKKKRRGDSTSGDGATDAGGNTDDTMVPASLMGSRRRSTPGVVSIRGNR